MIQEFATMIIWCLITFVFLITEKISINFAYIGMCMMLVAGLLHEEE